MRVKWLLFCGALAPLTPAAALARRAPHKALGPGLATATSRGPGAIVGTTLAAARKPDLTVTGTVTDEKGTGLPGVTVLLKGTAVGTGTDNQGKFSVRVPEAQANGTLVFSFVGYASQEVAIGGRSSVSVQLQVDSKGLDEVVVVGYGTQKRADVTGAVASVPTDRLEKLPVGNVAQALQGAVAGVQITSSSNVPGSQPSIQIRGVRSITAGTDPYIVLDGVPFPGNFNDISPTDISNIEILKDASSTAIYGTKGSNGVILVTTKHGKTGKPQVRYTGYGGPEYFHHNLQPLDGAGYVAKYKAFTTQMGLNPDPVPNYGELPNYQAGKETDWIKTISQQGFVQDHNVAVSGGSQDVKYYISGDYFKQQGVLQGYQFRRISIRSNLDATLTPWLKIGTSAFYSNSNDDGGRVNLNYAQSASPYGVPYNADGTYNIYPQFPELLYTSPLVGLTTSRLSHVNQLTGTGYAEVQPSFLDGLKYRLNASYSYRPYLAASYTGRAAGDLRGTAQLVNDNRTNYTIENLLIYNKDFGKHHFDLTALYSAQQNTYFTTTENGGGFLNDVSQFNSIGAGSVTPTISSYDERRALISQMARVNYSYDSRYLLTLTARRDGSSVFGAQASKYATFPSVAVGWNIANEPFLKDNDRLNVLKLRLSYGTTGNEGIPPYGTLTGQTQIQYTYGGVSTVGLRAGALGNANLKWEQTTSANIGLDFGLFKNRITGTVDYYDAQTKDLLLAQLIPIITGYGSVLNNIGKVQNRGLELTLSTVNVQHSDFTWGTSFNISGNRNKVLELYGNGADDIGNRRFIGKPLNAIYDYVKVGVWQTGEDASKQDPGSKAGDLKFADLNGDGKITSLDRQYLGTNLPDYSAGLTNTFTYKGLSLRVFIQTVQGVLRYNNLLNRADYGGRINQPAAIGYWTAENMNNDRPALSYYNTRNYGYPSSASYTRLKDVTLSYTIPAGLLERAKLGTASVYVSGRNLYTWTKWIGYDPEQNFDPGTGGNANNFPNVATFVLGLSLGLR